MTAKEILTLLQVRGYRYNRALGQHFLIDDILIADIVRLSEVDKSVDVLEIGPGAGLMTGPLADSARQVLAVELDRSLLPVLKITLAERCNVRVVHGDIMQADIARLVAEQFRGFFDVISNLPYSITTPVLTKLLEDNFPIRRITVMVQAEAADRVLAQGGGAYGPLAILAQYKWKGKRVLEVPRTCFVPSPHVDSVVLHLESKQPEPQASDEKQFMRLIRTAFMMRRKTLVNNLRSSVPAQELANALAAVGIDGRQRAEQVSIEQFVRLSNILTENPKIPFGTA